MYHYDENNEQKIIDLKLFKWFSDYIKPHKIYIIPILIAITITIAVDLYLPIIIKNVIDSLLKYRDIGDVKYYSLLYFLMTAGAFIFSYMEIFYITKISQIIVHDIRTDLFSHILKLPMSFFDKTPVGAVSTRVTNDINNIQEFFSAVILVLFKNVFIMMGIIIILFVENARLAFFALSLFPLVVIIFIVFRKYLRNAYRNLRAKSARLNAVLTENINGINIIQIYNRQMKYVKKFAMVNEEYRYSFMKQIMISSVFNPSIKFIRYLTAAIVIYFSAGTILSGALTIGMLIAVLAYVEKLFLPIQEMSEKIDIIQSAMASFERIYNLKNTPCEEYITGEIKNTTASEVPHNDRLIKSSGQAHYDIEFKNVWFAYKNDEWILKDFSLKIKQGQKTAIVGHTGSGKTTIINLLSRYYKIQKGTITIGGIDINDMPIDVLRKIVGIIHQDYFIFAETVQENISMGKNISGGEIESLSRYSNSYGFISKLSDGFKTEMKENGATISSGEKQLIAFTRLLAYNPKIIILDEATSNIDPECEQLISDALGKLTAGRTSLLIAHRLSTIRHCDNIIVLNKGETAEVGSHEILMSNKGYYYNLYQLQYA